MKGAICLYNYVSLSDSHCKYEFISKVIVYIMIGILFLLIFDVYLEIEVHTLLKFQLPKYCGLRHTAQPAHWWSNSGVLVIVRSGWLLLGYKTVKMIER